jgi:tyrosyl-tRNA synthetase
MNVTKRFELIKRNTQEIVQEEELKTLLKEKKHPVVYWGTAVTGKPSIAYLFPLLKLRDFISAGFTVKVLFADLHGALDGTAWEVLERRYVYYEEAIRQILFALGTDMKKIEFVKGSEFQLSPEYSFDILKLASLNSVRDTQRAAAEVVKFDDNPQLGGLLYPIMQALDEEYLQVDVQFGGVDQRKILMFARENHPKIGYTPRVAVMNPMIPGLVGKKMSSSEEKTKIDLTDSPEVVEKKIVGADMVAGIPDNGVMAFLKYVIMVIKEDAGKAFVIERDKRYGGALSFKTYEKIEKAFIQKELHPLDVKHAVAKEINVLLTKVQSNTLKTLEKKAY